MDGTHTGKFSAESVRAALRRVRGSALNFVPRDCEAEARPADETAEAEQGQRSAFCKSAATGAAKAGNRNHQGEGISVLRSRQKWVPPGAWRFCDTLNPGPFVRGFGCFSAFQFFHGFPDGVGREEERPAPAVHFHMAAHITDLKFAHTLSLLSVLPVLPVCPGRGLPLPPQTG